MSSPVALRCGAIGPAGIPRDVQTHGAIRNLDCEYCFFLSKDELYPGNGFRMDAEVHEAYVGQLLAARRGNPEVVFGFQGGEPTIMGLEFFRTTPSSCSRSTSSPGRAC